MLRPFAAGINSLLTGAGSVANPYGGWNCCVEVLP